VAASRDIPSDLNRREISGAQTSVVAFSRGAGGLVGESLYIGTYIARFGTFWGFKPQGSPGFLWIVGACCSPPLLRSHDSHDNGLSWKEVRALRSFDGNPNYGSTRIVRVSTEPMGTLLPAEPIVV